MNPTTQAAIAAAIAAIISSLVTAAIARRGQRGQERIAEWGQWREDNRALRERIKELEGKVDTLDAKVEQISDVRSDLETRLQHEQAIVGTFVAHLAEWLTQDVTTQEGIDSLEVPDAASIYQLIRDLRRLDFSATLPPQSTSLQPPTPKTP